MDEALYPSKTDGSQLTISLDDMDDAFVFKEMENIPLTNEIINKNKLKVIQMDKYLF